MIWEFYLNFIVATGRKVLLPAPVDVSNNVLMSNGCGLTLYGRFERVVRCVLLCIPLSVKHYPVDFTVL
jgi:hypothetical protein